MERPPPLPPRSRDSQQFLEDLERARCLSLQSFHQETVLRKSRAERESPVITGTEVAPRPRPGSSASLPRTGEASSLGLEPPPSLPPRRPVARSASSAASSTAAARQACPPLPPRHYQDPPPERPDEDCDLIQLDSPERAAAAAAAAARLDPQQLARLYDGGTPPPLPPRVPAHPFNSAPPPALLAGPLLTNGATAGSGDCGDGLQQLRSLMRRPPDRDGDLIDLGRPAASEASVRRSVLEDFDPLAAPSPPPAETPESAAGPAPPAAAAGADDDELSDQVRQLLVYKSAGVRDDDLDTSYYEQSDPFQYMYGSSRAAESIYEPLAPQGERDGSEPPPLPPRQQRPGPMTPERPPAGPQLADKSGSRIQAYKQRQHSSDNLISGAAGIKVRKTNGLSCDSDIVSFCNMIKTLRDQYPADDRATNPGLITSATMETNQKLNVTVKLVIYHWSRTSPVCFTCEIGSAVELVILQTVCALDSLDSGQPTDYVLRVCGTDEYLTCETALHDYQYVQRCIKYEEDVRLTLVSADRLTLPLQRTREDDIRDRDLRPEDLVPPSTLDPVTYDQLSILLECVERECEQLRRCAADAAQAQVRPDRLGQAVKAVCAQLGQLQTLEVADALDALTVTCQRLSEEPPEERADMRQHTGRQLNTVLDSVRLLLTTYCQAFRTDFVVVQPDSPETVERPLTAVLDTVLLRVSGLHRLRPDDRYEQYLVGAELYHGSRCISQPVHTRPVHPSKHFFKWVVFDEWLEFLDVALCCLPREARVVVTVYGLEPEQPADALDPVQLKQEEVGWAALQMFDFEGMLAEGGFILPLWPPESMKELGPAPFPGTHPSADKCTALTVDLPAMAAGTRVRFPPVESVPTSSRREFSSLDESTQMLLLDTLETDLFTPVPPDRREILWDRRHFLYDEPAALPRVLLAAHSWEWACLPDLHAMVTDWSALPPVDAIQLLLPSFPDETVRGQAVRWLQSISSDELIDYLPQLVQAAKHDSWDSSVTARFLLERALTSPRLAHHLYWLLQQCLPGDGGQASVSEARYLRRLTVIQRALRSTCGANMQRRFFSQEVLLRGMYEAAERVKCTKESLRLRELQRALEPVHQSLAETATSLPLNPALQVCALDVPACSYYPSNTLPLRLVFQSADDSEQTVPVIYKVGDDLRQDMLTIQMIRIMDKLWLKEGLDLRMVTFNCLPTGHCRGMIEMVQNAETLRKIQGEHGLTGAFKDMTIAEWLARNNPSELEYARAVENFTSSCAGYCVATYVLGICDRHNDNIMLRSTGHLFHIDFGKFLGDAQRFGAFKRDRAPFVLTPDMAYVINRGDKPSAHFQDFVDLCCNGFNILRRHGNIFLNLFALMTSSGIPGVSRHAVDYIQRALLPSMVEQEAAAVFARMIQESLKSWFTPVNFFLHSLAQLRFTGDHNDDQLLSFVPKRYTMEQDGRVSTVSIYGYQKRYEPEKCYIYILCVARDNQKDPSYVFRTYKEILEFSQKLTIAFPLVDFHSLPKGARLGRSHIAQVAKSRQRAIAAFLRRLWQLADEVRHSDITYTFLHPLLRDQHETSIDARKLREPKPAVQRNRNLHYICGQLQLSFRYRNNAFSVFVHHAKDLAIPDGQEPNAYVKIYLLPDPNKLTKRKTKVVKKSSHPSFMEMIVYRMPLAAVECRSLHASLWHQDHLQENLFLGTVLVRLASFDLSVETRQWYDLSNFHR